MAKTLEMDDIANLLYKTLTEEKAADKLLTDVAENDINYKATEEA